MILILLIFQHCCWCEAHWLMVGYWLPFILLEDCNLSFLYLFLMLYMQISMTVSRKYAQTLLIAFHHMFQIIRMEEVVTELIE